MPTETLDQKVRRSLQTRRPEWGELAKLADVSYSWVLKFVGGKIPNPGIRTLEKLQAALARKRARKARASVSHTAPPEA